MLGLSIAGRRDGPHRFAGFVEATQGVGIATAFSVAENSSSSSGKTRSDGNHASNPTFVNSFHKSSCTPASRTVTPRSVSSRTNFSIRCITTASG